MKAAVFLARLGNKIISLTAGLLIVVMLLYGGYSLWDTAMLYKGAFTSGDLLKYKPDQDGSDGLTLARLKEINPEVCGWLTVDETNIDYPVVQGKRIWTILIKTCTESFPCPGLSFWTAGILRISPTAIILYMVIIWRTGQCSGILWILQKGLFREARNGKPVPAGWQYVCHFLLPA